MHVICLCSSLLGDRANVLGTANAIIKLCNTNAIGVFIHRIHYQETGHIQNFILSTEKAIKSAIDLITKLSQSDSQCVILTAGEIGFSVSVSLKNYFPKILTSWSGHQLPDLLLHKSVSQLLLSKGIVLSQKTLRLRLTQLTKDTLDTLLPHFIALPKGVVCDYVKHNFSSRLIETIGVPHNLTQVEIDSEFRKWSRKDSLHPITMTQKKKILLFLGGDAPMPDGNVLCYTEEEAKNLANYVTQITKEYNYFIYSTNNGRVGSFDIKTGEKNKFIHHGNLDISKPTDHVSQTFISQLKENGLIEGIDFYFSDYRSIESGKTISAYKALFGLKPDIAMFPGESTSGISEGVDFIEKVIVYLVNSMNRFHYCSLKALSEVRPITVINVASSFPKEILEKNVPNFIANSEPSSRTIAKNILQNLSTK